MLKSILLLSALTVGANVWACISDSGCRLNEMCVRGECVERNDPTQECKFDADCPFGSYCELGQCYERLKLSAAEALKDLKISSTHCRR